MLAASSVQLILYLMFAAWPLLVKTEKVTKTQHGFNEEQKQAILQRHNDLRSAVGASNMKKMEWNSELETFAQNYVDKCLLRHNSNFQDVAGFEDVGENLYATISDFEPASMVQSWYDEIRYYNSATGQCYPNTGCTKYTQVVWADSYALGCGLKYCDETSSDYTGYMAVCNYGPAGNYVGERPYATE